jgi:hypothetical protein
MEEQADIDQASCIPYLPPEVHQIIAQHVHWADLANYRLASKLLADIGAFELFKAVPFHCSSASTARIDAIRTREHLNKYVTALTWDTNYWSIPNVRDLHEWQLYFMMKTEGPESEPPMPVGKKFCREGLIDLAFNRREWELYVDRLQDEKAAKAPPYLQKLFTGFKNLHKLHILNGNLKHTHRGIHKRSDYVLMEQPRLPASHYRGESLYNDDERLGHLQRPGGYAFTVLVSLKKMDWNLTKLRLDSVYQSTFWDPVGNVASLQHLASLHLRITLRFEAHEGDTHYRDIRMTLGRHNWQAKKTFECHNLMNFLVNLPKLRSLKLGIAERLIKDPINTGSPLAISHVFCEHHTWPNLEKLGLDCFDTIPEALLSLMNRHRSTLKVLYLHDMRITLPERGLEGRLHPSIRALIPSIETPPEVLTKLSEMLDLRRAKLTGHFGYTSPFIWHFDREDAHQPSAAEKFLVNGGTCPLNASNCINTAPRETSYYLLRNQN